MPEKPTPVPPVPARDLVLVGRFGAAHGVRGEVRLKSFTGDPAAIGDYSPVYSADGARSFALRSLRHIRDDIFVARVEGVNDRSAAEALANLDLHVRKADLPPADEEEYYHSDLIGLSAQLENGELIGEVVNVLNFGAGDILEVRPVSGGETLLYPFTKAVAPVVDLSAGRVTIAPPQESEAREDDEGEGEA
jgi:16S rRNA processing protein RimM